MRVIEPKILHHGKYYVTVLELKRLTGYSQRHLQEMARKHATRSVFLPSLRLHGCLYFELESTLQLINPALAQGRSHQDAIPPTVRPLSASTTSTAADRLSAAGI